MKFALALLAAALCRAQSPVSVPVLGKMVDSSGALRTLYGVAGSFTAGPPEFFEVVSSGCSAELCLIKTPGWIIGPEQAAAAPPGPAIMSVEAGEAVIYFPAARRFARWSHGRMEWLAWQVEGEVLSLRADQIAVRRGSDVWIVRPDGAILSYLPQVQGPVWLLDGAVLFASDEHLVLRRSGGEELKFALPGVRNFFQLGTEYVQAKAAGASYALRTVPGREAMLMLPEPPAPPPRPDGRTGSRQR